MICLCCGFSGFIFSGYNTPNHADLAPAYAGTLFGITNMIGTIPGFLAPQVNTMFIKGHEHEVGISNEKSFMMMKIVFSKYQSDV